MATANTIIGRALRLIKVVAASETIEAGIAADALSVLNSMGQRMLADGLLAAWTDAASVASTLTPPAAQSEALAANLAVLLAPEFEMEPPQSVVAMAAQGRKDLWRDRIVATSPTDRTAGALALRALRLIAAPNGMPDAVSLPGTLSALNALGARWVGSGLIESWTSVDDVADAVATAASADEAVIANLALRLCPEYGVPVSEMLAAAASQGVADLWRDRLAASVTANTAKDVIFRALRVLASAGRLPDSVGLTSALGTLNVMLAEWHEAEIGLPDYSLAALTTALTSDIADRDALAYALALRLAPEYGVSLSVESAAAGDAAMSRLRLRYFQPGTVDSALPGTRTSYDIEAG